MDLHPPPKGLDAIDVRLVHALLKNGRASNRELARQIGISEPTCVERRRRLEQTGVILGYAAVVAYEHLPFVFRAWCCVRLISASTLVYDAFEKLVSAEPAVVVLYATGGLVDYMFELRADNYEAAHALKARLEMQKDIVADIRMSPILKQSR